MWNAIFNLCLDPDILVRSRFVIYDYQVIWDHPRAFYVQIDSDIKCNDLAHEY